jgi:GrpB-like predicted nucleotidyltransferase (UPF0157 family)
MPTAEQITRHDEPDPDRSPWVHGAPESVSVLLGAYDPAWPQRYRWLDERIRAVLGDLALHLEHVGSTSVPGLAAKDVIDIDLTVADPDDEASYVPPLEAAGWRHVVREPWWHGHRMLSKDQPRANLHVFGPDSPELVRHRMFRDWLREHPDDRERYQRAKRAAVPGGGTVMDYNRRKQDVIRDIYDRLFHAAGLLP